MTKWSTKGMTNLPPKKNLYIAWALINRKLKFFECTPLPFSHWGFLKYFTFVPDQFPYPSPLSPLLLKISVALLNPIHDIMSLTYIYIYISLVHVHSTVYLPNVLFSYSFVYQDALGTCIGLPHSLLVFRFISYQR